MQVTHDLNKGINAANAAIQRMILNKKSSILVSVGGGSSSGKTSKVAVKVKEVFGDDAVLISADDYFRGIHFMREQAEMGNILNWDQPEAVEMELLINHLAELSAGQPIEKPVYDFKTGAREDRSKKILPAKVIIVEGLFVLDDVIANMADLCIFVEIGPHGRMIRRLFRDIDRAGQKPMDILSYFTEVVNPMHERYIESTKLNAHLIISNEYNPDKEADRAGFYQSQMKFRFSMDEEALRKLGAERLATVHQLDRYFNPADRDLSESDELIRLREESGKIFFAYKGPRKKDCETLKRPFIQFEINKEKEKFFRRIYVCETRLIEKTRAIYSLEGVIFTVDHVLKWRELHSKKTDIYSHGGVVFSTNVLKNSHCKKIDIGKFLEVHGNTEEVSKFLEKLDLNLQNGFKTPYFEM